MTFKNKLPINEKPREHLFDFYRSVFMLFVFFHHTYLAWPGQVDVTGAFNPFAELFVGLSGFMVGYVYLHRADYSPLFARGIIILAVYYMVSLPASIGTAVFGVQKEPVVSELIKSLLMMEDRTFIGILRFYGLIFILLPIILRMYKRSKRALIYASFLTFFVSTYLYQSFLYTLDSFFTKQVILFLFQWQIFFVFGLFIGDLYRNKLLSVRSLNIFSSVMIFLGIVLNYAVYDMAILNKSPYTFGKYINLMWSAPIILIVFFYLFKCLRGGLVDKFVRVVGRNSLFSFVASEIVMKLIKLFQVFNQQRLKWHFTSELPFISGVIAVLAITSLMWSYEYYLKEHVGLARWSR